MVPDLRPTVPQSDTEPVPEQEAQNAPVAGRRGVIVIVGIVGLWLRVRFITSNDLWNDEIFSLNVARLGRGQFRDFVLEGQDLHPPLYYSYLWGVDALSLGTISVTGLRLADLVSLVGVGAVAWVAQRRPPWNNSFLVAFLLIAVSPGFAYLGAELRMYGFLTMWLVVALWFLVLATRFAPSDRWRWVAASGACVAAFLTHYSGLVIVVCLLVAHALVLRGAQRIVALKVLAVVGVSVVLFSPIMRQHLDRGLRIDTSWSESGRLALMLGGLLGVAVVLIAIAPGEARRSDDVDRQIARSMLVGVGLVLVAAVVLYVVRDENIFTLGVLSAVLTVAIVAVAAARFTEAAGSVALLAACVVLSAALAAAAANHPTVFGDNRVATTDALDEAVARGDASEAVAIVHVDWAATSAYFAEHAATAVPNGELHLFTFSQRADFDELLNELDASGVPAYVISRSPSVLGTWPAQYSGYFVEPNTVRIEPALQSGG